MPSAENRQGAPCRQSQPRDVSAAVAELKRPQPYREWEFVARLNGAERSGRGTLLPAGASRLSLWFPPSLWRDLEEQAGDASVADYLLGLVREDRRQRKGGA